MRLAVGHEIWRREVHFQIPFVTRGVHVFQNAGVQLGLHVGIGRVVDKVLRLKPIIVLIKQIKRAIRFADIKLIFGPDTAFRSGMALTAPTELGLHQLELDMVPRWHIGPFK